MIPRGWRLGFARKAYDTHYLPAVDNMLCIRKGTLLNDSRASQSTGPAGSSLVALHTGYRNQQENMV
jgi:hypothetical protein